MSEGLKSFTLFHVVISLVAIFSGFVVAYGLLMGKRLNGWTATFLAFTVATSVTGFLFPIHGFTPAIGLGIISLVLLGIAIYGRYGKRLAGSWRWIYVVTAMLTFYFNFFVLIVQSFQKVPALKAIAPTGAEAPFKVAQLTAMAVFFIATVIAARKFRPLEA